MRTLPTSVQTLPPDGLVLDELISNMQSEFGTPATPQEYRLIVRVPPHEEPPAATEPREAEVAAEVDEDEAASSSRTSRRRRRGRRRPGATGSEFGAGTDSLADREGGPEGDNMLESHSEEATKVVSDPGAAAR